MSLKHDDDDKDASSFFNLNFTRKSENLYNIKSKPHHVIHKTGLFFLMKNVICDRNFRHTLAPEILGTVNR